MTLPKVPDTYWDALAHRREEAWGTVLAAESRLGPLRERDKERARRQQEDRDESSVRFSSLRDRP